LKGLIITADDYGMCDSVNRAIDACIAAKVVCSTNVMANMEVAEEAASLKKRFPTLSLGLHYNFTVGTPLSPVDHVRSLVNGEGEFLSFPEIRERCRKKSYIFGELREEMIAQYRRYKEICGEPDYWNTHENVHVYPGLYQLFRDVSLDLGIKKMRTHKRIYIPASNGRSDKSLAWTITNPVKQVMLKTWQHESAKKGVAAPDGLLVRMNEDDKLNLPYLFSHIQWKNANTAEIAIHPALDGNCKWFGEITEQRVLEYKCFSDPAVLRVAAQAGVSIVGFETVHC